MHTTSHFDEGMEHMPINFFPWRHWLVKNCRGPLGQSTIEAIKIIVRALKCTKKGIPRGWLPAGFSQLIGHQLEMLILQVSTKSPVDRMSEEPDTQAGNPRP